MVKKNFRMVFDFEKPVVELEKKIMEMEEYARETGLDLYDDIKRLSKKAETLRKDIYSKLTPWQRVQLARHPRRPYTLDYVAALFTDKNEPPRMLDACRRAGDMDGLLSALADEGNGDQEQAGVNAPAQHDSRVLGGDVHLACCQQLAPAVGEDLDQQAVVEGGEVEVCAVVGLDERPAVDQHRVCPALSQLAAVLGSGELQILAQHLEQAAVGRVIEYGSRLAGTQKKLSTRFGQIADLVREANYWATTAGHEFVTVADVETAIDNREYLQNRIETRTGLHTQSNKRFAAAGIEIAFPQQDIHLRGGWDDMRR